MSRILKVVRKLSVSFKKEDCWIGVYWSSQANMRLDVWICIIPMFPIHYHRHLEANW